MAVVDGRADIYLHAGGQYEWDNCAPAAVALGAGLHASRIDGSPLVYNCEDPLLPDILVCRAGLAQRVLAAIRKQMIAGKIGRASGRERVCQYVVISVVAVSLKKKKKK